MTLRADHVAGAAFILFGALIIALSGELPFGQLSMPGSGFLPYIVAVLTMLFGLALIVRAGESPPFAEIAWSDGKHALLLTTVTAIAIALYTQLGFVVTMSAMMLILLIGVERRPAPRAAAYTFGVVLVIYLAFEYLLKTPLPSGPLTF
ncbi:tripartite tricarboxylate transporter TctB family protein [Pseudolabrys taiwanensis]|uniref:Tripartite tricarboxylate transporter TctB family protein n=1 Tax=Pseudolabrys taiwanensis TaxID=331696 RepID=A0A345ZWG3_9HYPH|nr:tripartite tricarboxylate transporter TctB family protein [Pseudolabrys taiwanensis]AXK81260.1 tripartite tricarboxylate transporter TctB family protein [Pseudolabrys taiwanensis]